MAHFLLTTNGKQTLCHLTTMGLCHKAIIILAMMEIILDIPSTMLYIIAVRESTLTKGHTAPPGSATHKRPNGHNGGNTTMADTATYYMEKDKGKEWGTDYLIYPVTQGGLDEILKAEGVPGVMKRINRDLLNVAQGQASGKSQAGEREVAKNVKGVMKTTDPAKLAALRTLGLIK